MHGELLSAIQDKDGHSLRELIRTGAFRRRCEKLVDGEPTPLHLACFYANSVAVELIAREFPFDALKLDSSQQTPLHVAATKGTLACVQSLLSNLPPKLRSPMYFSMQDQKKNTALHLAILNSNKDVALKLIESMDGQALCRANSEQRTALHLAAMKGFAPIVKAIIIKDSSCMDLKDQDGRSPLILSVLEDHANTADLLVRLGCNVSLTDNEGVGARGWAEILDLADCIEAIEQRRSVIVMSPSSRTGGNNSAFCENSAAKEIGDVKWLNFDISQSDLI